MDNLNNFDDKFFLFKESGKSKLIVNNKNNLIKIDDLNNFDYVILKSILNNINLDNNNIKKNIGDKLQKLKYKLSKENLNINNINLNNLLDKITEIENDNKFHEEKQKLITNIFEYNQSGGGLLKYIGDILSNYSNKFKKLSKKQKVINFMEYFLLTYNSILGVVDILLDISLLQNSYGFYKYDWYGLNLTHLLYAILRYDILGVLSTLLALIPKYGEFLAGASGLGLNFYRSVDFIYTALIEEDHTIDDDDEFLNEINKNNDSNIYLENKYIPEPGSKYNQSFYERVKLL